MLYIQIMHVHCTEIITVLYTSCHHRYISVQMLNYVHYKAAIISLDYRQLFTQMCSVISFYNIINIHLHDVHTAYLLANQ